MPDVKAEIAPTGVLRAAINLSNTLLVTGKTPSGDPVGVSPDMAGEVAKRIGVPVKYITFATPGELADAAGKNIWDIGLIGAEPQRAEQITFSAAYCEIEATYLVPAGSPLKAIADVDKKGVRISVADRTAYGLWLDRNIKNAELKRITGVDAAVKQFLDGKLEALAGLKPRLLGDVGQITGSRLLDGHFMTVQQAIGTGRANATGAAFLAKFVEEAKASGFVAGLIARHKVVGLSVARPAKT